MELSRNELAAADFSKIAHDDGTFEKFAQDLTEPA
jgi:hypothetical protein